MEKSFQALIEAPQEVVAEVIGIFTDLNPEIPEESEKELERFISPFLEILCEVLGESKGDLDFQEREIIKNATVKSAVIYFKTGGSLKYCLQIFRIIKDLCLRHFDDESRQEIYNIIYDEMEIAIIDYWEKRILKDFSISNIYGSSVSVYEAAFQNSHSIMLIVDPEDGQIIDANPAASDFYGYSEDTLKSMKIADINLLTDPEVRIEMERANKGMRTTFNFQHILANGDIREVEVASGPILISGKNCLFSIIHDITERKKTELALAENEERLRRFMNAVDETILLFNQSLNLTETNHSADKLFQNIQMYMGNHLSTIFDHYLNEYNLIEIYKAQTSDEPFIFQTLLRTEGSEDIHLEIDTFRVGPGLGVIVRDISKQKEHEYHLQYSAHHDPLTRLPNRTLFYDRLGQAIKNASRNQTNLAVLFIDLDGFKTVNDLYGHEVGDRVLTEIGESLSQVLRKSDTVARIGGDEFTVLLESIQSPENARNIAEKILKAISRKLERKEGSVHITASIGISLFPEHSFEIENLIQIADQAMYKAKRSSIINISFP